MEKYLKSAGYIAVSLAASIIAGVFLLILAYCIPVDQIRNHVRGSAGIYETEGEYYRWTPYNESGQLDNFTDALILNEAAFPGTGSIVKDAMNAPYVDYPDLNKTQSMIRAVYAEEMEESANVISYARYWHGNLVIMKLLLFFINMSDIRILNMCFQLFLLVWVCLELYKAGGYRLLLPFVFAVMTLNPVSIAMSLQFTDVYLITLGGMLVILYRRNMQKNWKVFLWIGILTAYFDFLTYPILGLGINLLLLICLNPEDSLMDQLKRIFSGSLAWAGGYVFMWAGKWIAASALTGENVLGDAAHTVSFRTSGEIPWLGREAGAAEVIRNAAKVLGRPYYLIWGATLLIFVVFAIYSRGFRIRWKKSIPMIIVGLYPFAWYILVRNHSAIHIFFTYRNLAITVMAVFLLIMNFEYKKTWNVKSDRYWSDSAERK